MLINECIEYKLLSLIYKFLTTSQPDYLHNLISVQCTGRTRSSSVVSLVSHLYLCHYKSPTALSDMHHLTLPCGISSLLHSVNIILFTLLLVHLILCISPVASPQSPPSLLLSIALSLQTYISSVSQILSSIVLLSIWIAFADLGPGLD